MFKKFLSYYKPYKTLFILDMIASFIIAIIGMCYPVITQFMLSDWVPNKNLTMVIVGGCSLVGIYIVRALLRFFVQYYGHVMGVKMQADMRRDLFKKLQKLPYSYYDKHEIGTVLSTMTNDLFEISELAHHGPENIIIISVTIVAAFVYLLTINWILALLIFAMVPILAVISLSTRNFQRKAFAESKKDTATINASLAPN